MPLLSPPDLSMSEGMSQGGQIWNSSRGNTCRTKDRFIHVDALSQWTQGSRTDEIYFVFDDNKNPT